MVKNDMYINEFYSTEKRGLFSKIMKPMLPNSTIAKLIENSKDKELIETIRYMYKIHEIIAVDDIFHISWNIRKILDKHYDAILKGEKSDLSKEQAEIIEESQVEIEALLKGK